MNIRSKITRIRYFFKRDRIIYSKMMPPGKKLYQFTAMPSGIRYVRIAFTHKIKYRGMVPVTDIPFDSITSVRILPSPFKKWLFGLVGKKPKPTMVHFTKPIEKKK